MDPHERQPGDSEEPGLVPPYASSHFLAFLRERNLAIRGVGFRAEVKGNPSFDVTKTGAADAVRDAGEAVSTTVRAATTRARSSRSASGRRRGRR